MYVCILPLLPRFQVIEIEAVSFRGRRSLKAIEGCTTKADLFLRIFEPIPETLKPFRMW